MRRWPIHQKFDRHDLDTDRLADRKAPSGRAALEGLDPELRAALELAAERIAVYHDKQKPEDSDGIDSAGVRSARAGTRSMRPGIYVPGGRAAYPSTRC
jgi:histidinol dehydrogenase